MHMVYVCIAYYVYLHSDYTTSIFYTRHMCIVYDYAVCRMGSVRVQFPQKRMVAVPLKVCIYV